MGPTELLVKTALDYPAVQGKGLFLNASPVAELKKFSDITCQTVWRDAFRTLQKDGIKADPLPPSEGAFDYILCDIPKNMTEAEGLLATALRLLKTGGILMAAAPNDAGGRRIPALFEKAGLAFEKIAKARCTLCMASKADNAALENTADFQPVLDGAFISCPGIFGWDDIDIGSAALAQCLSGLSGTGADFGCGYGYLTRMALECGGENIKAFYSADADARAVEACRRNCPAAKCEWLDLSRETLPAALDFIVMNPPFHKGKSLDIALGQDMTQKAWATLKRGGVLWMVANNHLPYEPLLERLFSSYERLAQTHGYKVFRAVK